MVRPRPGSQVNGAFYFRDAPDTELVAKTTVEKGHGRIETRVTFNLDSVP
jgi:hypothetical protein